jgi:hypothetical protein
MENSWEVCFWLAAASESAAVTKVASESAAAIKGVKWVDEAACVFLVVSSVEFC